MAIQLRISDAHDYVHADDPDAQPRSDARVGGVWIDALGQPEAATRFRVRPLNAVELSVWSNANQAGDHAASMDAVWKGFVPSGAEDQPANWRDCHASIAMHIVGLILAVTMGGADPLAEQSA